MKQNKLFTLACFSLLSLSGLASCSGSGSIPQKVDCYFRAQAATITLDSKGGYTKANVDFKDDECAEMWVEDKEHLKYGEQDVVIHIKPKSFFTFKDYDPVTWKPVGGAFHPYVGLGNPHSLYNYRLPENVAWTFEDLSTGDFKEEYKITVKKEFFQKDIVIDYGNVSDLGNNVLTYNSSAYAQAFAKALTNPTNNNYYELDEKYCSFVTGSGGLTVTYKFKVSNPLFTFNGWDAATKEGGAGDKYKYYNHISVEASKKTDANAEPVELAKYDPSKKKNEQDFIPTVTDDRISFYIKWGALAEGEDKGYEPKYDTIAVKLIGDKDEDFTPSVRRKIDVKSGGEGLEPAKIYHGGYCQYILDDNGNPVPMTLSNKSVSTYIEGDPNKQVIFQQIGIFDPNSTNMPTTPYGVLFEVPENTPFFQCMFPDGSISVQKSDFDNPYVLENHLTNWRTKYYPVEGETELPFWHTEGFAPHDSPWYLVQINPIVKTIDEYGQITSKVRTNCVPEEYQGKRNLYYLFANGVDKFLEPTTDEYAINIDIPHLPHADVKLSDKQYGAFDKDGATSIRFEESEFEKTPYEVLFYYDEVYSKIEFTVKIECTTATGSKTFDVAQYIPDQKERYAHITFSSSTAGVKLEDGDVVTITLTPKV